MDEVQRLARVSSLLDQAKEILEAQELTITGASHAWSRVDEAQRVLLGDAPTDARDN